MILLVTKNHSLVQELILNHIMFLLLISKSIYMIILSNLGLFKLDLLITKDDKLAVWVLVNIFHRICWLNLLQKSEQRELVHSRLRREYKMDWCLKDSLEVQARKTMELIQQRNFQRKVDISIHLTTKRVDLRRRKMKCQELVLTIAQIL